MQIVDCENIDWRGGIEHTSGVGNSLGYVQGVEIYNSSGIFSGWINDIYPLDIGVNKYCHGIYANTGTTDLIIDGAIISNCAGHGIHQYAAEAPDPTMSIIVRNCTISNCLTGIGCYQGSILIENNTVSVCTEANIQCSYQFVTTIVDNNLCTGTIRVDQINQGFSGFESAVVTNNTAHIYTLAPEVQESGNIIV